MNDFNTNLSFETVSRSMENFVSIYNKMFEELTSRDMGSIVSRANCRLMDNKRIKLSFFKKEIIADLNKKKIYFLKSGGSDEEEPLDMYSSSLILHYL
ncbi:MAG: hypothetical protein Q8N27_02100, partial [Candidatus Hydromicrobium sp.]|nr:hypothetical protein [Candidatus Hydromicrobium sp.]